MKAQNKIKSQFSTLAELLIQHIITECLQDMEELNNLNIPNTLDAAIGLWLENIIENICENG